VTVLSRTWRERLGSFGLSLATIAAFAASCLLYVLFTKRLDMHNEDAFFASQMLTVRAIFYVCVCALIAIPAAILGSKHTGKTLLLVMFTLLPMALLLFVTVMGRF